MNELIKIEKQGEKETVNARELHEFLEVGRDFTSWLRQRVAKYGFARDIDYITCSPDLGSEKHGGQNRVDYYISIDMAKELSMVENNSKGRQARLYFIEREKQAIALSTPKTFAEALRLAADQQEKIEEKERQLALQAPKVEFYDTVADSKDAIPMGDVAKVIDCGMGRNKLFVFLRIAKVLNGENVPYQKYVDRGYFRLVERSNTDAKGNVHISTTTLVYQKGVDYISKLVKENI